ncbi:hypothetical protein GGI12_002257 [Dipsacomyces acuminosporus]|nr:hypothetical protein GGI12_002257 [Dipsacomyces acuminosporus]
MVEALTWNYDIFSTATRQRPITAQRKRQVSERRKLNPKAVDQFAAALRDARRKYKETQKRTQNQLSVLDIFHEKLMCLEADVEWGDPALIRSPTRNASMRTWTDPTRLNESMSVRNHLYIVGELPGSLDTLHSFVYGPEPEEGNLLEELTLLRDGLIGKGIWESYARKRVGVSWITSRPRKHVADMDPVDILIESILDSCFESLGGCTMSLSDLDPCVLQFSTLFAPLHRTRTYPSWSRKFAREISAVVDKFTLGAQKAGAAAGPLFWTLELPGAQGSIRIRHTPAVSRRWPTEGRLLRRYDLAEMVALAGSYKQEMTQTTKELDASELSQITFCMNVPLQLWPRIVTELSGGPLFCTLELNSLPSAATIEKYAVIARPNQPVHAGGTLGTNSTRFVQPEKDGIPTNPEYMAIVPFNSHSAAVYFMDTRTYARISGTLSVSQDAAAGRPPPAPKDTHTGLFNPSHIEPWSSKASIGLDIKPCDRRALDVSFDEAGFDCSLFEIPTSDFCLSSPVIPAGPAFGEPPEPDAQPKGVAVGAPTKAIDSMESWYSDLYLKPLSQSNPSFSTTIDTLATLCKNQMVDNHDCSAFDCLARSVLLKGTSIEDAFERSSNDQISIDDTCQLLRLQALGEIKEEGSFRRMWQLHECQLQVLLHLFALEYLQKQDSKAGERKNEEPDTEALLDSLHDLVDLLCIWASLDDISGGVASSTPAVSGKALDARGLDDIPDDLAAAFISSPLVSRFEGSLPETLEELRIQCGWVPAAKRDPEPEAPDIHIFPGDARRRKGTPRKIHARHAQPKSEVIVLQRQNRVQSFSGRKLARHLDELISSTRSPSSTLHNASASGSQDGSSPALRAPKRFRPASHLKLPPHLIRQIKSEVVSTTHPHSSSKLRRNSSSSSGGGGGAGGGSGSNGRKRTGRKTAKLSNKPSDGDVDTRKPGSRRTLNFA